MFVAASPATAEPWLEIARERTLARAFYRLTGPIRLHFRLTFAALRLRHPKLIVGRALPHGYRGGVVANDTYTRVAGRNLYSLRKRGGHGEYDGAFRNWLFALGDSPQSGQKQRAGRIPALLDEADQLN